ncbi:MAG: DUF4292 domain-containing protein [candidate division Zixibacteria bacterium]|nr:DUF4292 domain-containing protein [candidate division Zixibacteria bacterium]
MAFRRFIYLLWALILMVGISCGPKPEYQPPSPIGSPKDILNRLRTQEDSIASVAQTFNIDLTTPQIGTNSLNGTLYHSKDEYFLLLEGTLGKDAIKALITHDRLLAYNPIDEQYIEEAPSSIIHDWEISLKDLLNIIIGKFGLVENNVEYAGMIEGFYFYEFKYNRYICKLTVRPETKNITGIRLHSLDEDDNLNIDIRFANFEPWLDSYRPRSIDIFVRERKVNLSVQIESEKVNIDLPPDLFILEIPEEAMRTEPSIFWEFDR